MCWSVLLVNLFFFFFFFQAEDGIRDVAVTGVQTCALPILLCGGITVFAPLADFVKPTDRVGIVGIGGLGHMALRFANAWGRSEERRVGKECRSRWSP